MQKFFSTPFSNPFFGSWEPSTAQGRRSAARYNIYGVLFLFKQNTPSTPSTAYILHNLLFTYSAPKTDFVNTLEVGAYTIKFLKHF